MQDERRIALTAEIVAAYVSNNKVGLDQLPQLIRAVHGSMGAEEQISHDPQPSPRVTAAQIKRSITRDALISCEGGRPYRLLKRHLTTHGLSPAAYRERWGLPAGYPMVAPSYAAKRSEFASDGGVTSDAVSKMGAIATGET